MMLSRSFRVMSSAGSPLFIEGAPVPAIPR